MTSTQYAKFGKEQPNNIIHKPFIEPTINVNSEAFLSFLDETTYPLSIYFFYFDETTYSLLLADFLFSSVISLAVPVCSNFSSIEESLCLCSSLSCCWWRE
jgi:hypothetical protein